MSAANYDDVLEQLRSSGLIVEDLRVGTPRPVRCKVEGEREKRGWYMLHELYATGGDLLIVGSYGVWHGNDNGVRKIELRKREISPEQRDALRIRLHDARKLADQQRQAEANRAAEQAAKAWARCSDDGDHEYLARKCVGAYGVRFSPGGALVIPMTDAVGRIHGLQIIRTAKAAKEDRAPSKQYWPQGLAKTGHFHLIGGTPTSVLLIAEGYATAATLHAATALPVAVAFDANNLQPVALELGRRYRTAKILICADDDVFAHCAQAECRARVVLSQEPSTCPKCGQPHKRDNTGVTAASAAALAANGAWIRPTFAGEDERIAAFRERGTKLNDFNDLAAAENLAIVRAQIETRITALKWGARQSARETSTTTGEGGAAPPLKPIDSLDETLWRFALVYGQKGTVFDHQEHQLVALSDMRDACIRKDIHRAWCEHPSRKIVRVHEVGFDPAGTDPEISCNLWSGWPTTPRAGTCDKLLELLRYMCSAEEKSQALYEWVLRWCAYPIQHPGAKMKTSLVVHGPQGTGKNLFFEAVMAIYGRYGRMIDQSAIEDKFNDWASRKLFLIADEVVARSDLFHVKNRLKAFISGDWIRINPKNMAAYDERNHVNVVFLSNESMPVVLEEDDRRYAVVWTPEKLGHDFYKAVRREIADGGVEALHDFLLTLDLGEFTDGTLPLWTDAKSKLVNASLDSTDRFWYELMIGEVGGVKPQNGLSTDYYDLYRAWCQRTGGRAAPMNKLIANLERRHKLQCPRKRYQIGHDVLGPKRCVMAGERQPDDDLRGEPMWLGECISYFRQAVETYGGSKSA